jgi:hypothetical protein
MDEAQQEFFEDIGRSLDQWLQVTVEAATSPAADLTWATNKKAFQVLQQALVTDEQHWAYRVALQDVMVGLLHSLMVTLDGGSRLADQYTLTLTTSRGTTLGPGLNELLFEHLGNTERLPSEDDES